MFLSKAWRVALLVLGLIPTTSYAAQADYSEKPSKRYTVISWETKDGLPANRVWTIAQGTDGYLWLGTDAGLLRFDGAHFVPWRMLGPALPRSGVSIVRTAKDGSLWIGFSEIGGIARIQRGVVRVFGDEDGLPAWPVRTLVQDPDGVWWAGTEKGLFVLHGNQWTEALLGPSGAGKRIRSAFVDRDGNLLVGTEDGVYRRLGSTLEFSRIEEVPGVVDAIWQDANGTLWRTDIHVGFMPIGDRNAWTRTPNHRARGTTAIVDSHGELWVGIAAEGLWRGPSSIAVSQEIFEKTTTAAGMSGNWVYTILEDASGNIWTGTTGGLTEFRRARVQPFNDVGVGRAIGGNSSGKVWVLTSDSVVQFDSAGSDTSKVVQRFGTGETPQALHVDPSGSAWVATNQSLTHSVGGTVRKVNLKWSKPLSRITLLTSQRDGTVWLYDLEQKLFRVDAETLTPFPLPALLDRERVQSMFADSAGNVWLGFSRGLVAVIDAEAHVQTFGPGHGLLDGNYNAIYEDSHHSIWLANADGLTEFSHGQFFSASRGKGFPLGRVVSLIGDRNGFLWLGTYVGLIRVHPDEFRATARNPSHEMQFLALDRSDGVIGFPNPIASPNAAASPDGRLWFLTGNGVSVVDPLNVATEQLASRVNIEGIVADGARFTAPWAQVTIPPRTVRIEIQYSNANLNAARQTRFRYRLDDFDKDWVEGDAAQLAVYTNLPPRNYVFRILANDGGGKWDPTTEATLAFAIEPTFYQTSLFYTLCAILIGLAATGSWLYRMRQMRQRISAVFAERLRLGREMHDTLLQSLLGVGLQLDALALQYSLMPDLTDRLARLRKVIGQSIDDARLTILDLRSRSQDSRDLIQSLRVIGRRIVGPTGASFRMSVNGVPKACDGKTEEQVMRIAQEALMNAARHAKAKSIHVELRYDTAALLLRISDDGHGFDAEFSSRSDHFGIVTMTERSEQVGGRLELKSSVGRGTQVEAVFPL